MIVNSEINDIVCCFLNYYNLKNLSFLQYPESQWAEQLQIRGLAYRLMEFMFAIVSSEQVSADDERWGKGLMIYSSHHWISCLVMLKNKIINL